MHCSKLNVCTLITRCGSEVSYSNALKTGKATLSLSAPQIMHALDPGGHFLSLTVYVLQCPRSLIGHHNLKKQTNSLVIHSSFIHDQNNWTSICLCSSLITRSRQCVHTLTLNGRSSLLLTHTAAPSFTKKRDGGGAQPVLLLIVRERGGWPPKLLKNFQL